ncbi:MAG: response regulator [Planctomycetota bacterium]
MPIDKDVLTTGEVAAICKVAPRTVSKWFDSGALPGYRIPGSKDRRIPLASLIDFMRRHRMPLDGLQTGSTRVLIVDGDPAVLDALGQILSEQTDYEVLAAQSSFEAGMLCEKNRPHVLLVDLHLGDGDAQQLLGMVRGNDQLAMTRVVAMSGKLTDGQAQALQNQGFDGFLKKPFPAREALRAIESVASVAA